jgi:hypothetical protein
MQGHFPHRSIAGGTASPSGANANMTIDDVIAQLTDIVDATRKEPSKLGYFAALYRKVTIHVKQGIAAGRFQDGPRMEKLDVAFASRYLDALGAFRSGQPVSQSWRVAFNAANSWAPIILQHLLAGMNAHINLDLGVAAAQVAPGAELSSLQHDFNEINDILFSLVTGVEKEVASVSPWIGLLEKIGGKYDDVIVEFSMSAARKFAWDVAQALAPLTPEQQTIKIKELDLTASLVGIAVLSPPGFLRSGLLLIRARESSNVAQVIDVLAQDS